MRRDLAEAAGWYRRAAEQGLAEAQHNLAMCYAEGRGVQQDDEEAVVWSRRAAEQGDALAQFSLALMYGMGRGVPQDNIEAHKWLGLAEARATGADLDQVVQARKVVARWMTRKQVAEARRRVQEWENLHR